VEKKSITYVSPNTADDAFGLIADTMSSELPIAINKVTSIEELFPLMSDPKFHTDFVAIDIDELYRVKNTDVFDIINTLNTLIKCTVARLGPGRPTKRTTKIVALVDELTDPRLIKEVSDFPEISWVALRLSEDPSTDFDSVKRSLMNFLNGGEKVPQEVKRLIQKNKKRAKHTSDDQIALTPRQAQIYDMIVSKGASNKIIARALHISESTVKLHMTAILKKFGVRNRTQLAVFSKHRDFS